MERLFHPVVQEWFESRFETPTEAQAGGWPAIAAGSHTLISAPTGSGKTLAAFLICIDRLLRDSLQGALPDLARVVYVSPLKALSSDVHKNLAVPLQEISDLAHRRGLALPEIRVALRTGDTPAHERQARARKPPHIWITTPESLYILQTSASGRRGLGGVDTLILDEIHAVADNKRGSHLALSVERLCALASRPVTRVGLSATQRPIEEVARFLVGADHIDPGGNPRCSVVDVGHQRGVDLQVEVPDLELGPIATNEHWDATVSRLVRLVGEHRSTLVFVNTRRLVERVAFQLSKELGEEAVAAHHGSLSRKTRLRAEERLKTGAARVCVATASLELGIDVGTIDLVCQVGSPRSIGVLLQRIGRAEHRLGGISKGRIFPLTRDELIECAALLYSVRHDDLEHISIPPWPLDILAQQVVAMCSAEDWGVSDLYDLVRRAWPYRELPREDFDSVIRMLSEGISSRVGRRGAYLHYDGIHQRLRARRGARIAALTSGGAIPDSSDLDVVLEPEGTRIGTVFEDFAVESMAGDIFLLGNSSWRIRRIEKNAVRVEDARGQAPNIPFWIGEAPSRSRELSLAVSAVREGIRDRLADPEACRAWLREEAGLSTGAAELARAYFAEGLRVLGSVPTAGCVVAERFFDESGGTQLVLHAPFGGRINRAWGLALRKRFCRSFDYELQASATDDGINLSLGPQQSFPLEDIFRFLHPAGIEEALVQALLPAPVFRTRWRWTLTRSLQLPRMAGGRKVPPALQRMRADDLLAAVFPAQAQCQDNRPGGDVPVPGHPLVFETMRDCLTGALDVAGLRQTLERMERGEIELRARETPAPSVFAHQIVNAMPYAFLDDAPIEERRARAVMLRRSIPESTGDLGRLDTEAVRMISEDAWPSVRDAEELHDALLGLVLLPVGEMTRWPGEIGRWIESLERDGRVFRLERAGVLHWMAAERRPLVSGVDGLNSEAVVAVVRGWVEVSGPLTAAGLAARLRLAEDAVASALAQLEGEGLLLRGRFTEGGGEEFCDRRILARIHRATLSRLRREIEPVSTAQLLQFLFEWQHLTPGTRRVGESGVLEVIDQLQGFETAAAAWESEVLAPRVEGYRPEYLDSLCLGGEVVWGRWARKTPAVADSPRRTGLTRSAILGLALRESLPWLLDPAGRSEEAFASPARDVLALLEQRGASFFGEIISGTRLLAAQAEDALWQLVAAGRVTADSFGALRALVSGDAGRARNYLRRQQYRRRVREGRWSLLASDSVSPEARLEFRARQYMRRYGVLLRELLSRESGAPPWRELVPLLRALEARGEIRGGRFVAGMAGEQYALPEAVDCLRAVRRRESEGSIVAISSCDPLNLVGILTPGGRITPLPGTRVEFR